MSAPRTQAHSHYHCRPSFSCAARLAKFFWFFFLKKNSVLAEQAAEKLFPNSLAI